MTPMGKSGDKRQAILNAAEKTFGANGYAATTIEQIAADAGISKGSVYNYFRSKQDLFMELFAQSVATDEAQVDTLLNQPIPASRKIEALLDMWFKSFEHYERIGALFLEYWATAAREHREGGLAATFQQMYARWRGRIAAIIEQGIDSGQFRRELDTQWVVTGIMAMLDGLTIQAIVKTGVGVDEGFLAEFKRGLLVSLTAGAAQDDSA
ncbi:MAG: TetR/AcrR family transcriptional regulator [Phycisphaerae bacterium]|nr:TetR/AcrR family transcriptional regulator [Phycisphaerae bacterium]